MKAFLLAAGSGTRLRPLTYKIPKCLVPINGHPLLYYWLILFEKYGITDVLINMHHLPDLILNYIFKNNFKINIHTVYEQELMGSAGTIRNNFNFVCDDSAFLVCYSDNLTNINLADMIDAHRSNKSILTLGLFQTTNPKQCGIAEIDQNKRVISFVEKPKAPKSNLAGAGIYIANHEIFHYLPEHFPSDIGYDVLPQLVGKMHGYHIDDYFIDIGTMHNYQKACNEFPSLVRHDEISVKNSEIEAQN